MRTSALLTLLLVVGAAVSVSANDVNAQEALMVIAVCGGPLYDASNGVLSPGARV